MEHQTASSSNLFFIKDSGACKLCLRTNGTMSDWATRKEGVLAQEEK